MRKRETKKWAQRCANNVTPAPKGQHEESLPNYKPDLQDAADMARLRAYGRSCCYPNLSEPPTWLEGFMTAYRPYLLSLAYGWLPLEYHQDAEDILHTALMRSLGSPAGLQLRQHDGDAGAFFINRLRWEMLNRMVVVNRENSRTDYKNLSPFTKFDDELKEFSAENPQATASTLHPEGPYIAAILVRDAFKTLTPTQREVLEAYLLQGYTAPEIAEKRDRCLATIKDLIARGRHNLTAALSK